MGYKYCQSVCFLHEKHLKSIFQPVLQLITGQDIQHTFLFLQKEETHAKNVKTRFQPENKAPVISTLIFST